MKRVIKKLFSLLLVGVVAVSMFSFISPNRVDAAGSNSKFNGKFRVWGLPAFSDPYKASYEINFYNKKEVNIKTMRNTLSSDKLTEENFNIPKQAQKIVIETTITGKNGILKNSSVLKRNGEKISKDGSISILHQIASLSDPRTPGVTQEIGKGWVSIKDEDRRL